MRDILLTQDQHYFILVKSCALYGSGSPGEPGTSVLPGHWFPRLWPSIEEEHGL